MGAGAESDGDRHGAPARHRVPVVERIAEAVEVKGPGDIVDEKVREEPGAKREEGDDQRRAREPSRRPLPGVSIDGEVGQRDDAQVLDDPCQLQRGRLVALRPGMRHRGQRGEHAEAAQRDPSTPAETTAGEETRREAEGDRGPDHDADHVTNHRVEAPAVKRKKDGQPKSEREADDALKQERTGHPWVGLLRCQGGGPPRQWSGADGQQSNSIPRDRAMRLKCPRCSRENRESREGQSCPHWSWPPSGC